MSQAEPTKRVRGLEDELGHEGSVLVKDLYAIVHAVADVDQAVVRDAHAVHGIAELLRGRREGS